jgi:GxxExxY protein
MSTDPQEQEDGLATKDTKVTKYEHEGARRFAPIPAATDLVSNQVIGAAIEVHRTLGPGFLERIYREALCLELDARGMRFERERPVAVCYRNVAIPGQRIDLIVETCVLVELKATSRIDIAREAKVISYLRTTGLRLGLLLNFNCRTMREGLKRIVL